MNKDNDPTWQRAFGHMKMKPETERKVHKRVANYLRTVHPRVRFVSTLDGERFGTFQASAIRALQWGRGVPDLLIFCPDGKYAGLAIEIKKDFKSVFKKDGGLKKSEHLEEQYSWLKYLRGAGWKAEFGAGYDHCIELIESHINKK